MTVATFMKRARKAAHLEPPRPREVVVLSGGGRLGAAQVGALQSLLDAGIVPDAVVGSSVGAINAAYIAMEPTPQRARALEEQWRNMSRHEVFPDNWLTVARRLATRANHIYSPESLRAALAQAIPQRDLAESVIPCHVVTTDLHTGEAVWWTSGDPIELLSASACLPGLFPPVTLKGRLHVDGGVACPVPTQHALDLGARRVWVLSVSRDVSGWPRTDHHLSALDVLLESFAISRAHLAHHDPVIESGQQVVKLPSLGLDRRDLRDFSQTARLLEAGRAAGAEMVEAALKRIPAQREPSVDHAGAA